MGEKRISAIMNNSKGLQLVKFPSHPSAKPTQPGAELEQLLAMLDIGKNQFLKWKELVRVMRQLDKDLTFDEISALAQRHAQNYERFLVSNAPIRALEVRVGEMKFWTTILNRPDGIKESTFERMLPENALLQVWRQADEEFDDIPLLFQDLAEVSREGLSRTQQYSNDRSLTLEVSKNEIGEYKIKLSFVVGHETDEDAELLDLSDTEEIPKVVAIPASQVQSVLPNVHRSIPAYLYSAAVAVLILGLIVAVNGRHPFQLVDDSVPKLASTSPSSEKEKTEEQHSVLLKTETDSRKVEDTSTRKESGNVSPDGTSTSLINATGNDYNGGGNPTVGTPTSATVIFTVTLASLNENMEAGIFNTLLIRQRGFEDDGSDKDMVLLTVAEPMAVPKPTSMLLLGTGLIGAAAGLRKRLRR